jgi:acetoin utilization deacetylase AcuC-like enzyme
MVSGSTGGVIAAVREAFRTRGIAGSLSSGLHHARADRGSGFCTINGIAVAVDQVIRDGAKRVLILDVDAHCGGGTASIIRTMDGVEQVDISVNRFDSYPSTAQSRLVIVDEVGSDGAAYLAAIEASLAQISEPSSIEVMIVNAGVDPHEDAGGVSGITAEVLEARERMIFAWANENGVPVAWVLAGGYLHGIDEDGLVDLHMQTIRAAAEAEATRQAAAE